MCARESLHLEWLGLLRRSDRQEHHAIGAGAKDSPAHGRQTTAEMLVGLGASGEKILALGGQWAEQGAVLHPGSNEFW